MKAHINFCGKCLEKKEYSVLNYEIKDNLDEVQFKCIKHNEIKDEENIIQIHLCDALKIKLNYCKKHDKNYSAWCNKCKNNLCCLCIKELLCLKKS